MEIRLTRRPGQAGTKKFTDRVPPDQSARPTIAAIYP